MSSERNEKADAAIRRVSLRQRPKIGDSGPISGCASFMTLFESQQWLTSRLQAERERLFDKLTEVVLAQWRQTNDEEQPPRNDDAGSPHTGDASSADHTTVQGPSWRPREISEQVRELINQ